MSEVKDVSGKVLNIGDTVAFCAGGRGTDMRLGKVGRMTGKSVIILIKEARQRYNSKTCRWDLTEIVDVEVIRAFGSVCKVEVAE